MPNKTIYVSDGDLKLYQRAQELAGGNLSAAIATALKRYVDIQEGLREGFDDVVVRVGVGAGRKVRFTGLLVGEWTDSRTKTADHYRVWRGRKGKYVVHMERNPDFWMVDPEGKPAGWRGHLGQGAYDPRCRRTHRRQSLPSRGPEDGHHLASVLPEQQASLHHEQRR